MDKQELIDYLKKHVEEENRLFKDFPDMGPDKKSFLNQTGIVISVNEANFIIEELEATKAV